MAQNETLDFSGLFKLDVLVQMGITSHSFYELGLKKFLAISSDRELLFVFIDPQSKRNIHQYSWDFFDNPIFCMCFEPSGTWVAIISDQKLLLVPFLPIFAPQNAFDCKLSLSSVTVFPLGTIPKPITVVWWLTKESEDILIIASRAGIISFYSLEAQSIIAEVNVPGEISDLQICFDDSLDLLDLLISSGKTQQWKLVLEHRSCGYNWLQQVRAQADKDKREGFMSFIKQLSKDKITLLIQGASKDANKSQTVEYVLKPTEYLPAFRKGSNNWSLTSQYVNGRHFLNAFEINDGTLILESPEEDTPSRTLRPHIKKDGMYMQALWSQRLIYLLRRNEFEIHSSNFSVIQSSEALIGTKREFTELWAAELIGDVKKAYLLSAREPPMPATVWKEPTFLCDLQLPRFSLESCLIVTDRGVYLLNTVCDPCEWLVGLIMRGGGGAELCAAGLGAPVGTVLKAAADMLLSRGKVKPSEYLYSLSQSPPDGWLARLGVFGRLQDLTEHKHTGNIIAGSAAITIKLLAALSTFCNIDDRKFHVDVRFTNLSTLELTELSSFAASIGLWDVLPVFTIHCGHPHLMLSAMKARKELCRGAITALLRERCLVPLLLEENAQWLFDYIKENCLKFDKKILKCLCLWMNPMQDQLRPVMRDIRQGIHSIYTTRLCQLISTFAHIVSAIELLEPCPQLNVNIKLETETWKNRFSPQRALSCGLGHWAVADEGNAKIMMTSAPVNTEIDGRVISVACGRHHTIVLTENGLYAAGDNSYGQLGCGSQWSGAIGDAAQAKGALLYVAGLNTPVVSIAAGHYHSACIDTGARLYTWGWNVHGQLGHGTIVDECAPKLVKKLQGRKVISVGCGACHTVVLTQNGEVFAFGAGVFGQLGSGGREKSSLPVRVAINEFVDKIAVGYFHNLALTNKGGVLSWGASPQQVRAAHARRAASPPSPPEPAPSADSTPEHADPHLLPGKVNLKNLRGKIIQLSAGWHHSCLLNNMGDIYGWGLNFDGQLGSGDRKQITIPTEIKIHSDPHLDSTKGDKAKTPEVEIRKDFTTKALIACGGDFTIFINDEGKIYGTGNMHLQDANDKEKGSNRVIMMKTTKRVIKIPATKREGNRFLFQPIDRIDIMFPFDTNDIERQNIQNTPNPLKSMRDFKNNTWADKVVLLLQPWIKEKYCQSNPNIAAKLAYQNKNYADCLNLLLQNLKCNPQPVASYLVHTQTQYQVKDKLKEDVTNIVSQRIKSVALTILNNEAYPVIDPMTFHTIPCCCDESKYLPETNADCQMEVTEPDISIQAAAIIDKCISLFPIDSKLWEQCFRLSKDFYLDNNLCIIELEKVLRKYMDSNATTMAAAILYSNDCEQYSKILTPKFYLNMCSQVMDTWG